MADDDQTVRRYALPVILVVVVTLIGAVAGLASAAVRPASYTSEAQLSWNPSVRAQLDPGYQTPDGTTFDRQVADQQDVVLSDGVVGVAAKQLDVTADDLRAAVEVTSTAGSSVFTIDATASSAVEAQRIARAVTDDYVDSLRQKNAATLRARISALTPVIAELRKELGATTAAAAGPLATSIATLQSESAAYSVAARQVPVEASVLRAAAPPDRPSSFSPFVTALIGAVLGLVLGVCLALLAHRLPIPQRAPRTIAPRSPRSGPKPAKAVLPVRIAPPGSRPAPDPVPDRASTTAPAAAHEAHAEAQPEPVLGGGDGGGGAAGVEPALEPESDREGVVVTTPPGSE